MYSVQIRHEFNKPVEEIFAALADHENLHKVFVLPVKRVKDGKPDVNGVGSVRKLGFGPLGIEETVTALAQNERINYQITKGGQPLISQHKGAVAFTATASGCAVAWDIEFESPNFVIGNTLKFVLGQAIGMGLKRLG